MSPPLLARIWHDPTPYPHRSGDGRGGPHALRPDNRPELPEIAEQGPTCAAFLERAIEYFAARGITRIERLITDNAWAYKWSLRNVCSDHGIRQKFIKPHCPWQNGKVERFNRTFATEWAYRRAYTSNTERRQALAPWLEHYNTQRRHSALGGHPPISRLTPTS